MLRYVLWCALVTLVCAQTYHRVITGQGTVVGYNATDGDYAAFYHIPYGGLTTGQNRFKAPTPAPIFPGDFYAINSEILCAQLTSSGSVGIENCLTLSIFTKNLTTPKPVMVYIQSEDYARTDTRKFSYKTLVEEDVVVVTMNYRLSIFGFLCLGVEEAPGNAGLKDVIQGLKWINQNIAGFGGDPNRVTLFGHGSGAAVVDLVTLSPQSAGLVHRAVVQSGSALAPWAVAYQPLVNANRVGSLINFTQNDQELALLLQNLTTSELIVAANQFQFYNNTVLFAPCIENANLNSTDAVLTDAPINILRSGNYTKIPYITGYTTKEGTLRAQQTIAPNWLPQMQANFGSFIPADLDLGANHTAVAEIIRQFYFAQSMVNVDGFLEYQGDAMVVLSLIRGAKERASSGSNEVYLWEFDYRRPNVTDWPYDNIVVNGVAHGGLLNFLFDYDTTSSDQSVSEAVVERIVTFVKTGSVTVMGGVTWNPVTPTLTRYIFFRGGMTSPNITVFTQNTGVNPHENAVNLWNPYYEANYVAPTTSWPTSPSSASRLVELVMLVVSLQLLLKFF